MSQYDKVQKGALKLKGVADSGLKKKKKKKSKDKAKRHLEQVMMAGDASASASDGETSIVDKRTQAEIKYEKVKQQRAEEQIVDKASQTHKERIMGFNRQLDAMTEHFDIPKVSWTK